MKDFSNEKTVMGYLPNSFIVDKQLNAKNIPIFTITYKSRFQNLKGVLRGTPNQLVRYREILLELSHTELREFIRAFKITSEVSKSSVIQEAEVIQRWSIKTKEKITFWETVVQLPFTCIKIAKKLLRIKVVPSGAHLSFRSPGF